AARKGARHFPGLGTFPASPERCQAPFRPCSTPPAVLLWCAMSSRRWPYFLLLLTFLLWSSSFVAARVLVGEQVPAGQRLGPVDFVIARFLPVALVTWPWLLVSRSRRAEVRRLLRAHGPTVVVLGLLSVWTYNLPFAAGQHLVP